MQASRDVASLVDADRKIRRPGPLSNERSIQGFGWTPDRIRAPDSVFLTPSMRGRGGAPERNLPGDAVGARCQVVDGREQFRIAPVDVGLVGLLRY
jgi:hypothetical protein